MNCCRKSALAFPWAFVFPLRRGGTCAVRTWNCSLCATWAPLVDPVCFLSHHVLLQEPPRYLATPRGASQCAGVPPPAWLNPAFLEVWAEGPTEWGSHGPSRAPELHRTPSKFFILGAKFAPSSHFFAICLHFFRTMFRSCVFYRFLMVFEWILEGLGKVLGVFWRWFFTRFSKNSIFEKTMFSLEKINEFKGLGLRKINEKTMKIHSNFALKKKQRKNRVKMGSGTLRAPF